MLKEELYREFAARYGKEPDAAFFCPGRVNLIGEHIDYNGGRVMPCAITKGTWLAMARKDDPTFHFEATAFPETADIGIQDDIKKTGNEWFQYPLGVIREFADRRDFFYGLDLLYAGNLPVGSGLSSSASIEVLTGYAWNFLFSAAYSNTDIALLAQRAENDFIGVKCGIMDQFAVAMGKKDRAILLDCDTLDFEYLPFEMKNYVLAVIDTRKKRTLADSKYNERFAECRKALAELQTKLDVNTLASVSVAQLEMNANVFSSETIYRRARHVVTENARVSDAVIALQTHDTAIFGKLMFASHASLKNDYEVSCRELDTVVDFCAQYPGCVGARMTGAGFGGCAIALVEEKRFDAFSGELASHYEQEIGYPPGIFATRPEDGVHLL